MIRAFLDYLRYERNRSPLTVVNYQRDLEAFEAFFTAQDAGLDWTAVDEDLIRAWMEQLMDQGQKATSVSRRLSALRTFYRYALSRHLVERDPTARIRPPKTAKPLPQFLKEDELARLFSEPVDETDFLAVRDRTILLLFYSTGIRRAELLGLQVDDINFGEQQIKVTGKRNKQRIVPFGPELSQWLYLYINVRARMVDALAAPPDGQPTALFLRPNGNAMSAIMVHNVVHRELSKVTTLKKRSPHVLRHSFATDMLNHGASLEAVRKLLGHASLATTQIYTHTTFEQLRRSYQKAHPRETDE